jgi:hypothetical protein
LASTLVELTGARAEPPPDRTCRRTAGATAGTADNRNFSGVITGEVAGPCRAPPGPRTRLRLPRGSQHHQLPCVIVSMAGTAVADIVLDEARRGLDSQEAALTDARSRAALVFTVAGLTSSFLAGPALSDHKGMPWLAWVALSLLLCSALAAVAVLWPRTKFQFSIDPHLLLKEPWATLSPEELSTHLARFAGEAMNNNTNVLERLWWGVRVAMVLTLASIAAWVFLLAKGP